jgi:hypothetical protein
MRVRQHRHPICPDFISHVTVGGDAICPTMTRSIMPRRIKEAAMLSAMRVTGMPSLCSSQAVSRAPCRSDVSHRR